MAYTPGTWVENVTVIHAADLARIEAGIVANAAEPIGTAAQAAATSNTAAAAATLKQFAVNAKSLTYGQTVNGVFDNTAGLDAAFADAQSAALPLYIPGGSWVYNGNGMGSSQPWIFGDPNRSTTITLGAGKSLVVSPGGGTPSAVNRMHIENICTTGGFGLVRLTYTGPQSGVDKKIVNNCWAYNFTGAAVSSLATDDPYWKIKIFAGNGFSGGLIRQGIGVALNGNEDACDIDIDAQGLFCAVKFGQAGNSGNIRGSWVGAGWNGTPAAVIWIVPRSSSANAGRGLNIEQFRFGAEGYDPRDFPVLYADDDTTGTDFVSHRPLYTTASTGYIQGHRIHSCLMSLQGAPCGPAIFSTTPNVRGCHYDMVIHGSPPSYILQFLTAPPPDTTSQTNFVRAQFLDQLMPANACVPCNAPGMVKVDDPMALLGRDSMQRSAFPGTGNLSDYKLVVNATPTALVGATKTAVADSMGGTDAYEVTYTASGQSLYGSWAAGAVDVGKPAFIECEVRLGQTGTTLTDVSVSARDGSGALSPHVTRYLPLTANWVSHIIEYVPRANTLGLQLLFSSHNETSGTVQIGRVNFYQARSGPLNVRGRFPDQAHAPGGVITKYKTSGTPSDADMTRPSDGAIIGTPSGLWMRAAGVWTKAGSSGQPYEFGGFALTVGEETLGRDVANTSNTPNASGRVQFTYFVARKTETTTQMRIYTGITAAATTTHAFVGLYAVDSSGNLTLVAATADDVTLFAATNTQYVRTWLASYAKIAGQRYALGTLVVAATAPAFLGQTSPGSTTGEQGLDPRLNGISAATGLVALPATLTAASVSNTGGRQYAVILP